MTLIPYNGSSVSSPSRDEVVKRQVSKARLEAEKEALRKEVSQLNSLRGEITKQLLETDEDKVIELSKKARDYLSSIGDSKIVLTQIKEAELKIEEVDNVLLNKEARKQALTDQIDVLQTDLNKREDDSRGEFDRLDAAVTHKEIQLDDLTKRVSLAEEKETAATKAAKEAREEAIISKQRMLADRKVLDRRSIDLARLQKRLELTYNLKLNVK